MSQILAALGENPGREGLLETPARVARAYAEILEGYHRDLQSEMTVFENSSGYDDLVISAKIDFCSMCEHHLLPFWGHAVIGYIPDNTIIGLSKLSRAVDIYARRLQDQERLTVQVADSIVEAVHPRGVAVMMEGQHMCNMIRGVEKKESIMRTIIFRGALKDDPVLQTRFLTLARDAQ
ncbi:MAG: GTP cyclohydrolase I FolE [Anaerolineae bacterium]|nr:GTP cyclohydrolase I FolE [Anaerolineae bacterium]